MKKSLLFSALLLCLFSFSQSNNNGRLDNISEFTTIKTVQFTMPDGVQLATDIYLPIISDSITTTITVEDSNYVLQLIPKGTQLFVYDSIGNTSNPNPYQLPMVFTRTPYNKGSYDPFGIYFNVLGYAYALQDMRGRYASEGVYIPMYSDSWDKSAYHPWETHSLDITALNDPKNAIYHQDGRHSIDFIKDSLFRNYDLDHDGIEETTALTYNGSVVMFGASALGNSQYQAASAFKNDISQDGLKGLVPIVATNEHFNCVLQHNGVFRQALVQGWLTGQLEDNVDTIPSDIDLHNTIHSIYDYGNISGDSVINLGIDYITTVKDIKGVTGMYPNFEYRTDANASFATVNSLGESDPNGKISRYTNLELPIYHLTGWWDIFIDGQLDTYQHVMANTSSQTQRNQKIIIGPWTHATIGRAEVADLVYPEQIFDIKLANTTVSGESLTDLVEGDLIDWFRYLLNYDDQRYLGEPKVLIPESEIWQNIGTSSIRVPSSDTYIDYADFINYLSGFYGLNNLPIEINTDGSITTLTIDLPADSTSISPGTSPVSNPVNPPVDFEEIPTIRFYVPGPVNDGIAQNANVGNYWTGTDQYPLVTGWKFQSFYFHDNEKLDTIPPSVVEESKSYKHDPDDPIYTIGGGNLAIPTPQMDRVSAGPMNYADTSFASVTMNRPGVISFETAPIVDSLSIIGIPKAKIYASSSPLSGPTGVTDTDFFIRVLDVYPNGESYFVVEGTVNARARNYAKQLTIGEEDITIPYSNIEAGKVYEYVFNLLPIAYTFGHKHKMKVLISSSNWPRYQSNANVPIEDGDFFRRTPNDGKSYNFNGVNYSPRVAEQTIYFSPDQPSQILLPVYDRTSNPNETTTNEPDLGDKDWLIYPNPIQSDFTILTSKSENYSILIYDIAGNRIYTSANNNGKSNVTIQHLAKGTYIIELKTAQETYTEKLIKR